MKVRVFSDVWGGARYWGYCVYDPTAPTNHQWRRSGHGRRSWAEALADGCAALRHLTRKAAK